MIKAKYIGISTYSLRYGKIYEATIYESHPEMLVVVDESKEEYVFPKELFEIVEDSQ